MSRIECVSKLSSIPSLWLCWSTSSFRSRIWVWRQPMRRSNVRLAFSAAPFRSVVDICWNFCLNPYRYTGHSSQLPVTIHRSPITDHRLEKSFAHPFFFLLSLIYGLPNISPSTGRTQIHIIGTVLGTVPVQSKSKSKWLSLVVATCCHNHHP